MRHKVYGKHLSRDIDQRTALFKSLVQGLILSETIQTTEAKAKAIKGLVDQILSKAKSPSRQRFVKSFLTQKKTQDKLFTDILPRLGERNSGFTSVVKLGKRLGDGAMMVQMKLLLEDKAPKEKSLKLKKEGVKK